MSKVFKLQYYPLGLAAKHLNCEEIELLILAHSGDITLYQYPDPALLIGYEPVAEVEIGAMIVRQTKTGQAYQEYVSSFDTQLTDVVLPAEEMEKASRFLNMSDDERKAEKKVNTTAKQCRFIAGLLRALKFTDEDFKGSLPELIKKIEHRAPAAAGIVLDEGKTLSEWLRKAKVR
ncbi:hypothetical protein ISO36_04285 [Morganella morganii subsp. morganii]|uniref:hypothetical protein n=1 Tax=Morganella morganii TaxID=582 RepID=UPI001BDAA452|nr:hypothetical protein [Morganella morganii]MBT0369635.1 hypothetical protein [Morganella morganii subsp. morganii]